MNPRPIPPAIAGDELVALAERDPHRPRYHVVAPAGWLNDPNGVGRWNGRYHLFYQYNPHAAVHHKISWGHLVSDDLVRWTDLPVALVPDDDGPDRDGCYSGVLVDDDGTPTLLYSGHCDDDPLETCCLAVGTPDLTHWTKEPGNPVLATPDGLDLVALRDHCVWREGGRWRQLIGAGLRGVGGTALLFESDNLRAWRYLGPLVVGDPSGATLGGAPGEPDWSADMWECVDFFRLAPEGTSAPPGAPLPHGGCDVLMFSAWSDDITLHSLCLTGRYAGDRFEPAALHRVDLGENAYYAPQSFADRDGRRVVHGWLQEERDQQAAADAGWSGAMAIPRTLSLDAHGAPRWEPILELLTLRREQLLAIAHAAPLRPGASVGCGGGLQLDAEIDLVLARGTRAQLILRASDDDTERTVLEVGRSDDPDRGWMHLDRSTSSLDPTAHTTPRGGTIPIGDDGHISLRVLVDNSVLEIFANGHPLSARVYPTLSTAVRMEVAAPADQPDAPDGAVVLARFDVWRMADAWDGPRPLWPRSHPNAPTGESDGRLATPET